MNNVPSLTLNNGVSIPQFGLGVYQISSSQMHTAISTAISAGYRLFDTASMYGNEASLGEAIRRNGIAREELFITTKLWNSDQGYDSTFKAFQRSLDALGTGYVDLYLIHWPGSDTLFIETWKAFEELYEQGLVKAIGVSNFSAAQLETLRKNSKVTPAVNQIQLHPYKQQKEIVEYCKKHSIIVEAWSPIGGPGGNLLDKPVLKSIGDRYAKTPAQIVLRWHIQKGYVVIPKSSNPDRITQNIDIFDFELSEQDMSQIDTMS